MGGAGSGKTSLVQLLSRLTGHKLHVLATNSAMDTTELLGGFEQVGTHSPPALHYGRYYYCHCQNFNRWGQFLEC